MTSYLLNSTPIEVIREIPISQPEVGMYIKNAYFNDVIDQVHTPIYDILLSMRWESRYRAKYCYVDIKVQKLRVGHNTANGLWHLDSSLNPEHKYENFLYVSGANRTEFMKEETLIPHQKDKVSFHKHISAQNPTAVSIPDKTIVRYNGYNVHRGAWVHTEEIRLLIRLINTDRMLPRGKLSRRICDNNR